MPATLKQFETCSRLNDAEAVLLATFFEMPRQLREALPAGLKAIAVWDYIESKGQLDDFPFALQAISRDDLLPENEETVGVVAVMRIADTILVHHGETCFTLPPPPPETVDLPPVNSGGLKQVWQLARPWKTVHSVAETIYREYREIHEIFQVAKSAPARHACADQFARRTLPRLDIAYLQLVEKLSEEVTKTEHVQSLLSLQQCHPAILANIRNNRPDNRSFESVTDLLHRMRLVSFRVLSAADRALNYYLEVQGIEP